MILWKSTHHEKLTNWLLFRSGLFMMMVRFFDGWLVFFFVTAHIMKNDNFFTILEWAFCDDGLVF